jgi:hypothetical protein
MADALIVLIILAFISLWVGYVEWCDRIVRRDAAVGAGDVSAQRPSAEVAP